MRFGRGLGLLVALVVVPSWSARASAQTAEDLAGARALFAEALKDEQAGQNAQALEKFQRVQQVKDTPQVRYRIGSCLERLGKLKSARESYQAAVALGEGERGTAALVASSRERVSGLTRRIPDLTVSAATPTPPDAVIKVDESVLPPSSWQTPLALDPGDHAIEGNASGYETFHATSTLAEGAHASMTVTWKKIATPPGVGAGGMSGGAAGNGAASSPNGGAGPGGGGVGSGGPGSGGSGSGDDHGDHGGEHPGGGISQRTWGWVGVGAGAAFLATSGIVYAMRHGEISTIKDACGTGGQCPQNRQNELQSAHDRAVTEGTVSIVFAGVGVVAVGAGVALILTAHPAASSHAANEALASHLVAGGDAHGGSIGWRGSF